MPRDLLVALAANKHGIDENLLSAMFNQESGGNKDAVSSKGAGGVGQLMPATARELGVTDRFDPVQNIDASARYLKQHLVKYKGDKALALAAYNAGPGAVDAHKGIPPYKETQQYVKRILGALSPISEASADETPTPQSQPRDLLAELAASKKQQTYPGQSSATKIQHDDPTSEAYLDTENGAPLGMQFMAGLKATKSGKLDYLKHRLGADNVMETDGGDTIVNIGGKWRKLNTTGLDAGDFAGLSGDVVEATPSMIGAVASSGNPLVAAGGQAAGTVLRQGISAALPGDDQMTIGDRAADIGGKAAMAGALQGSINIGGKVLDKVNPRNVLANAVEKRYTTPIGQEGERLSAEFGDTLTTGQISGSKGLLTMEGVARRHPASADIVQEHDNKAVKAAYDRLDGLMNRIADPNSSEAVGNAVADTYHGITRNLVDKRAQEAKADFDAVEATAGDVPVFSLQNTVKTIDKMINDLHTPVGTDTANKTLEALNGLKQKIQGDGTANLNLTPKQFQRTLQIWGNAAKGTGNILEDLGDKATNRMINKRLFGAIQEDLSTAASAPGLSGEAATSLKIARDRYRDNSKAIDEFSNSLLAKLFKGPVDPDPTRIADKLYGMNRTEAQTAMQIISDHSPETGQMVKRHILERILEKSGSNGVKKGADNLGITEYSQGIEPSFSALKLVKNLNDNGDKLSGILGKDEYRDIVATTAYLRRIADRAGTDGSPTAPLHWAIDMVKGTLDVARHPAKFAGTASSYIAPRKMAQIMTTPEGRQALRTVSNIKDSTKARTAAIAELQAIIATDPARE